MDKIQELHGKLFMQEQTVGEYMKAHASITEDLMGRFAEWVMLSGYDLINGKWQKVTAAYKQTITTEKLIQIFKETL